MPGTRTHSAAPVAPPRPLTLARPLALALSLALLGAGCVDDNPVSLPRVPDQGTHGPADQGPAADQGPGDPTDLGGARPDLGPAPDLTRPEPDLGRRDFLEPCDNGDQCLSGYCVEAEDGRRCTRPCNDDCPEGWDCLQLVSEGGDASFVCLPRRVLCIACADDEGCGGPDDLCLPIGDGTFCGRACPDDDCPQGYSCQQPAGGDPGLRQCMPESGWCTPCRDEDGDRHRGGPECSESLDCDDQDPEIYQGAAEACDGKDNDCDGATDEGFDLGGDPLRCGSCDRVCSYDYGRAACVQGECRLAECEGGHLDCNEIPDDGCEVACRPTHEGRELCDGLDNDCDCATDEDTDFQTDAAHCGGCDRACAAARCGAEGEGWVAYAAAVCQAGECSVPDPRPCGLYRCNDDPAAPACAQRCESDPDCVATAHCEDGACVADRGDGAACTEDRLCASGHCGNGFCCEDRNGDGSTSCCGRAEDCPAGFEQPSICADAATCQGQRRDRTCEEHVCGTSEPIADDRGCGAGLISDECGLYLAVRCSGEPAQADPPCPQGCRDDGECDPEAHCDGGRCLADLGSGAACDEASDCAQGLFCADGVCCRTACEGLCQRCDLSGDGTCAPVPRGADPDEECGALGCEGYYWGWQGASCLERQTLGAASVGCDGGGRCMTAAQLCPSQGPGRTALTCDALCQRAQLDTCSGTQRGSCSNINAGNQTCGVGECQRTQPICVNGATTACVPGAAQAETCDDRDNDCDGSTDEGLSPDAQEPSGACNAPRRLAAQVEAEPATSISGAIYPAGDTDTYVFRAQEDDENSCECCDWFCTDEDFRATVTLVVPAGQRYRLCVAGDCGGLPDNCLEVAGGTSGSRSYAFDGACCPGVCSDSHDIYVQVTGVNGASECVPYTLRYSVEQGCF